MIQDVKFIPGTIGAYALSNSGTVSAFHYTSNPFAAPVAWNDVDIVGSFKRIVPELNGLNVYIQGDGAGTDTTYTDDLNTALGSQSHVPSPAYPFGFWNTVTPPFYTGTGPQGTYSSSGGRTSGGCIQGQDTGYNGDGSGIKSEATLIVDLGAEYTITDASFWHVADASGKAYAAILGFLDGSGNVLDRPTDASNSSTTWRQFTWSGAMFNCRYVVFTAEMHFSDGLPKVDDIGLTYLAGTNVVTRYSDDTGITFQPVKVVGALPSGGMDTQKVGNIALCSAGSQVFQATNGGVWSIYSGTLPTSTPSAIFIPRTIGTLSNVTSAPVYLLGSGTVTPGSESLWIVRNNGSLFQAISPKIGGTAGAIVSPEAIKMNWNSGNDILAIAKFSNDFRLCVSNNLGGTWRFTSLDTGADAVAMRRSDLQHKQAILANGNLGGYVPDYQGTVVNNDKHSPASIFHAIDVYG